MKVYLHTGAGKTGTSAIQVALARLRPQLAAAGILYPAGFKGSGDKAEQAAVSSGNAFVLGGLVNANKRRPGHDTAAVMAWLADCVRAAAGRDLLFSSEAMQSPRAPEAAELCAFFTGAGYEVTVIHYVRHALDQAIAGYQQNLKRGLIGSGEREKLQDRNAFLYHEKTAYLAHLDIFAKILPPERLIVRLYDQERSDLVAGFLRLLRPTPFVLPKAANIINRSPTAAEEIVFAELSRQPDGKRLCRTVAELALNGPASGRADQAVTEAEFADFVARNQPIVDAVNSLYLKGNGELLIKSDRIVVGTVPPPAPAEVYAAFAKYFALFHTGMRNRQREGRKGAKAATAQDADRD